MQAPSLGELRALSDGDLVKRHDQIAQHTGVGKEYFINELARREQNRSADAVRQDTRSIKWFTVAIAGMTFVNASLSAWMSCSVCATGKSGRNQTLRKPGTHCRPAERRVSSAHLVPGHVASWALSQSNSNLSSGSSAAPSSSS